MYLCDKKAFRTAQKQRIAGVDKAKESAEVCALIERFSMYEKAISVAAFIPMADEVDILPLLEELLARGKRLYLPRCQGERMDFIPVATLQELQKGTFGLLEPTGAAENLPEGTLVLTPGLAFDKTGGRLGRGKGYYDRFFAENKGCIRMGIGFSAHLCAQVPSDERDVPLQYLCTPEGIWTVETKEEEENEKTVD